jgi:DNA-binding NtrC family response regulator
MGLVLWIDQNTFSASLVERVFKKKGLGFYSLSQVHDFSYLVDDLKPAVIVLDGATFEAHSHSFLEQFQKSATMQATPFIFLDPKGDLSFITSQIGMIPKPFDPFSIPALIEQFQKVN